MCEKRRWHESMRTSCFMYYFGPSSSRKKKNSENLHRCVVCATRLFHRHSSHVRSDRWAHAFRQIIPYGAEICVVHGRTRLNTIGTRSRCNNALPIFFFLAVVRNVCACAHRSFTDLHLLDILFASLFSYGLFIIIIAFICHFSQPVFASSSLHSVHRYEFIFYVNWSRRLRTHSLLIKKFSLRSALNKNHRIKGVCESTRAHMSGQIVFGPAQVHWIHIHCQADSEWFGYRKMWSLTFNEPISMDQKICDDIPFHKDCSVFRGLKKWIFVAIFVAVEHFVGKWKKKN